MAFNELKNLTSTPMKRLALFSVFVAFLFCYLEWPPDNSMFVFNAVYLILFQQGDLQNNLIHPAILLPLLGELILLYQVFQKTPSKRWAIVGMALPGLLVLLLLFIGIAGQNIRIIAGVLPFLVSVGWVFWLFRGPK
jgi:hypothetical protein